MKYLSPHVILTIWICCMWWVYGEKLNKKSVFSLPHLCSVGNVPDVEFFFFFDYVKERKNGFIKLKKKNKLFWRSCSVCTRTINCGHCCSLSLVTNLMFFKFHKLKTWSQNVNCQFYYIQTRQKWNKTTKSM